MLVKRYASSSVRKTELRAEVGILTPGRPRAPATARPGPGPIDASVTLPYRPSGRAAGASGGGAVPIAAGAAALGLGCRDVVPKIESV
jgi:hypothetical protein